MQEYMRSHGDGSSQKLLHCPMEGCDKVLTSAPGLRYHIKTHSGPERPFLCDRCQKTFKSANGLKYHLERTKCDSMMYSQHLEYSPLVGEEPLCRDTHDDIPCENSPGEFQPFPSPLSCLDPSIDLSSMESPKKCSLPVPPHTGSEDKVDWLKELAIIATGPQSPLIQKSPPTRMDHSKSSVVRSLEKSLHSYAHPSDLQSSPPWSLSPDFSPPYTHHISVPSSVDSAESEDPHCDDENDAVVTSSSLLPGCHGDAVTCNSSTWSHSWPTAVWQCFIKGCKIRFLSGVRSEEWQTVQVLSDRETLTATATRVESERDKIRYAQNGLSLLEIAELTSEELSSPAMELQFSPMITGQSDLLSRCLLDHPFFVKNKGWSSCHPSGTAEHYGIPCRELEVGDICLPPSHPDATFTEDVFKSHDFTPMDTSAVFALSNMKKQRLDQESSPKRTPESPSKRSPTKCQGGDGEYKPKRPMNSFMLFAKRYRLELTQKFPGRDNRAISVMLGDKWKHMKMEERGLYAQEARLLADEQKKIHPDCWKRRRNSNIYPT